MWCQLKGHKLPCNQTTMHLTAWQPSSEEKEGDELTIECVRARWCNTFPPTSIRIFVSAKFTAMVVERGRSACDGGNRWKCAIFHLHNNKMYNIEMDKPKINSIEHCIRIEKWMWNLFIKMFRFFFLSPFRILYTFTRHKHFRLLLFINKLWSRKKQTQNGTRCERQSHTQAHFTAKNEINKSPPWNGRSVWKTCR